jgi:outer membrane protein insertion porin family
VKISEIVFEGNDELSNSRLKKSLKKTKEKAFYRFWKKSKYIPEDYQTDLQNLKDTYAENGFRDARILLDTFTKIDNSNISLKIKLEEGKKYYFGDINFVGNTVYGQRSRSDFRNKTR